MLKYMRAEIYKVLHRRYTYLFLLVVLACEVLLVSGWVFTNARGNDVGFATGAGMLTMMLSVGLYCTVLTGDIVFSDQYKFNTLKNEVSYGISRSRIYMGKLIVSCVTALVLCAVIVAAYVGMCYLTLPHGTAEEVAGTMRLVGYCLLAALPLWLGGQALVNLVYFLVKSNTVAAFLVVGVIAAAPQVFKLLGILVHEAFTAAYNVMLTTPFDIAPNVVGDWGFIGRCFAIGGAWFVACTAAGLVAFRRREIN